MAKKKTKAPAKKAGFPTVAVILLVIAVLWILSDIGVIAVSVPWLPVILAVVALGWVVNNYKSTK